MEETPTLEPLPTPTSPPPQPEPKRLRRRSDGKVLGGVCGGIADYFGIDPIVVRVAAVLLVVAGGFGILAYLVAWALIPADDGRVVVDLDRARDRGRRTDFPFLAGVVLVGLGAIALLNAWDIWWADDIVWPLVLLGAGAALLFFRDGDPKARKKERNR